MTERPDNEKSEVAIIKRLQRDFWNENSEVHSKMFDLMMEKIDATNLMSNSCTILSDLSNPENGLVEKMQNVSVSHHDVNSENEKSEEKYNFQKYLPLKAMINNNIMLKMIRNVDMKPLTYLTKITTKTQKPEGEELFRLVTFDFHFSENPFFANPVLSFTAKASFQNDESDFTVPKLPKFSYEDGTKIDFKGWDFREIVEYEKDTNFKHLVETSNHFSFFNFFELKLQNDSEIFKVEEKMFVTIVQEMIFNFLPNFLYFTLPRENQDEDEQEDEGFEDPFHDEAPSEEPERYSPDGDVTENSERETSFTDNFDSSNN